MPINAFCVLHASAIVDKLCNSFFSAWHFLVVFMYFLFVCSFLCVYIVAKSRQWYDIRVEG